MCLRRNTTLRRIVVLPEEHTRALLPFHDAHPATSIPPSLVCRCARPTAPCARSLALPEKAIGPPPLLQSALLMRNVHHQNILSAKIEHICQTEPSVISLSAGFQIQTPQAMEANFFKTRFCSCFCPSNNTLNILLPVTPILHLLE